MPPMLRAGWLTLFATTVLACTTPETVHERPWIEIETPNFRIASTLGAEETVELATHLELFRTVVQTVTSVPTVDSVIPTKIFVFDRNYDFQRFARNSRVAGYFIEGMRANHVAMTAGTKLDEVRILRHEYVHFLMHNATRSIYPPWYSEGFAEFLSTVTLNEDGSHVIIGAFPMDRTLGFRYGKRVSWENLISTRPDSTFRGTMFYEQSWALVHWLQLGRGSDHVASEEMRRYLELLAAGYSDGEAFEEAFGISIRQVHWQLATYLRGNYEAVAVPLSAFDHRSVEPRVIAMAPDAIGVDLGEHALALGDGNTAQDLFENALAANPTNARAQAGLGAALTLRGRWDEAEPHLLRALALDPEDAENELDYAIHLHIKALEDEMEPQRAALLKQARRHYVRSYRLGPGIPETYAMYGKSFLAPREDPARGLETLEHAYSLLPSNTDILRLLAQAYVRLGRENDARPLVERVVARSHSGDRAKAVDELLAELAETDEDEAGEGRDEDR
jgi:Flp pilus assembly protein TadD